MFTQLFGNYLLKKGIVNKQQLTEAIRISAESHIKIGSLAIHCGYMTPEQVERVYICQTHEDLLFGQIAIREGYINEEQLDEILREQTPSYLKIGQTLVEQGVITRNEFDVLVHEYQTENEISSLDSVTEQMASFQKMISTFCSYTTITENTKLVSYLHLLFNNLIRFIGADFTPLNMVPIHEHFTTCASSQEITGRIPIQIAIDMESETGIHFASRYAGEDFIEFDEYCQASLDDFLNLHNGLFLVNMSNMHDIELGLNPPLPVCNAKYVPDGDSYFLPVIFTFGIVNFIFTI